MKTSLVSRMLPSDFISLVGDAIANGAKNAKEFGKYAAQNATVQPLQGEDCTIAKFWENKLKNCEKEYTTLVRKGTAKAIAKIRDNAKFTDKLKEMKIETARREIAKANELLTRLRSVEFDLSVALTKEEKAESKELKRQAEQDKAFAKIANIHAQPIPSADSTSSEDSDTMPS